MPEVLVSIFPSVCVQNFKCHVIGISKFLILTIGFSYSLKITTSLNSLTLVQIPVGAYALFIGTEDWVQPFCFFKPSSTFIKGSSRNCSISLS